MTYTTEAEQSKADKQPKTVVSCILLDGAVLWPRRIKGIKNLMMKKQVFDAEQKLLIVSVRTRRLDFMRFKLPASTWSFRFVDTSQYWGQMEARRKISLMRLTSQSSTRGRILSILFIMGIWLIRSSVDSIGVHVELMSGELPGLSDSCWFPETRWLSQKGLEVLTRNPDWIQNIMKVLLKSILNLIVLGHIR